MVRVKDSGYFKGEEKSTFYIRGHPSETQGDAIKTSLRRAAPSTGGGAACSRPPMKGKKVASGTILSSGKISGETR